jgi:hypothetical protein
MNTMNKDYTQMAEQLEATQHTNCTGCHDNDINNSLEAWHTILFSGKIILKKLDRFSILLEIWPYLSPQSYNRSTLLMRYCPVRISISTSVHVTP